ncbi:MAG: Xaa-Pro aminopeptidase [Gemmatimonadota bacterium]|nr:Xaa-Pro aminopeptidase [Gemmatimonadota bacterium]
MRRILIAGAAVLPFTLGAQIPASEFAARRDSLAAHVKDGVVVALGGRTPVSDYGPFYQLPAFHYLTNFDEPDAGLVMVVRGGHPVTTLFLTPIEPRSAFYNGRRPDSAAVVSTLGVNARAFASLGSVVDSLAATGLPFYSLGDNEASDFVQEDSLTRGGQFVRSLVARHPSLVMRDGHAIVDALRAKKSPAEIALLRKAAEISSEGHRAAMTMAQPTKEYEIQAALEYTFMRLGGARPSYGSIVGGGVHGTQLHYMRDRGDVQPGDVVVMDAATEYEGYAGDVTRTIPVSGTYTPAQRDIYQLVLDAQLAAERNSKPGMLAAAASDSSFDIRARGLAKLGLIESVDAQIDMPWTTNCTQSPRSCRESMLWMIHGISHGLGLEVHDPAQFYTGDRRYKEGDAFTIEPGIYISLSALDALPDTPRNRQFIAKVKSAVLKYENTGVRIEDDYVITANGLERMSTAPREMSEIEALMHTRPPRIVP